MKTTANEVDSKQGELLRDAAAWRLIGMLFECPNEEWREQIQLLARGVEDADLRAAALAAREEASEGAFHSIFGPGGPAAPREVSHREWGQTGYLLAEISSYYEAFHWHTDAREAPDHVSVETNFIAYLRMKEAYAYACDDAEHAAVTAEAAERFIAEHLRNLAEPLAQSLAHSGVRYLALTSATLLQRVGRRPASAPNHPLPVLNDTEDSAFACGEDSHSDLCLQ
jgi:nitrate reductase assembly molybdenum cofactor insertion protein NarJ